MHPHLMKKIPFPTSPELVDLGEVETLYDGVNIKYRNNNDVICYNEDWNDEGADIAYTSSAVTLYTVTEEQLRGADHHHATIF